MYTHENGFTNYNNGDVAYSSTEYTLHGKNIVHMTPGQRQPPFLLRPALFPCGKRGLRAAIQRIARPQLRFAQRCYDAQNRPAIVEWNNGVTAAKYAYIQNLQGDIVGIVDSNGTEVVKYTYDAWGRVLSATGSPASTLGTVQPFRYRGYVYDIETELYYLRSRFMSPSMSRFCNTDIVIGKVQINRHNLYTYCDNKPIRHADAQGMKPYDLFDSELEAVLDFASCYNNNPIEYASMIYESEGQFFYSEPQSGTDHEIEFFNFNPDIPIQGTPISFVHTHTNDRSILTAYWPSDYDIYALINNTYSHAYLVVPDNSVVKMTKDSNMSDVREKAFFQVKISAISGGVKEATDGCEMNIGDFQRRVSDIYKEKVKSLLFLWGIW